MHIGIIGTGRMASALGRRWATAGHTVFFGSREPEKAAALASELGRGAQGGSVEDAAAFGDAILLTVPWAAAREVVQNLSTVLSGKLLLDATNNLTGDTSAGPSAVQIQGWAPGAHVVKAFNTVFSGILAGDWQPGDGPHPVVFMVGNDAGAKASAARWVADAGFEAVDAGTLAQAGSIDMLAQFIIHLGYGQGLGTGIAYGLLHLP